MDKRTFLDGLRTALVSLPASEIKPWPIMKK